MAQFGFMQAEPSDMRARGTTGAYKRRKASAPGAWQAQLRHWRGSSPGRTCSV